MATEIEVARGARRRVEQVRLKLLAPTMDTFSSCEQPLAEAIACLEQLLRTLPGLKARPGFEIAQIKREVRLLESELRAAGALLAAAGSFYEGLGRLMSSEPVAGTAYGSGANRPFAPSGSLSIHG